MLLGLSMHLRLVVKSSRDETVLRLSHACLLAFLDRLLERLLPILRLLLRLLLLSMRLHDRRYKSLLLLLLLLLTKWILKLWSSVIHNLIIVVFSVSVHYNRVVTLLTTNTMAMFLTSMDY